MICFKKFIGGKKIHRKVQTFSQYLYMRHFVFERDHEPLVYIFGPKIGIQFANQLL